MKEMYTCRKLILPVKRFFFTAVRNYSEPKWKQKRTMNYEPIYNANRGQENKNIGPEDCGVEQ